MQKTFRYVHENTFPELKDKNVTYLLKICSGWSKQSVEFLLQQTESINDVQWLSRKFKTKLGLSKSKSLRLQQAKKPMRTYAWEWWKKRENMQLTASAGNVKRAKPRLILLSQLIGQPKFHLRSNWSERVGCRKSCIKQLGLTKQLLLEVTKTALTWRPNVNGNITRMPSNYCTTYADKVIKIKNPPLILKQIPLAFSTFQCFLLIAFLTSHNHCEGWKFWNKAEMKQASSKTNSKYSQVYRS